MKKISYVTRTKLFFNALRNPNHSKDTFLEIENNFIEVSVFLDALERTGLISDSVPDLKTGDVWRGHRIK